jgi:hypothetical protein
MVYYKVQTFTANHKFGIQKGGYQARSYKLTITLSSTSVMKDFTFRLMAAE